MTGDHELESEGSDTEAASPLGSTADVGGDRRMIVHAGAGGGGSSQGGGQGGGSLADLASAFMQLMNAPTQPQVAGPAAAGPDLGKPPVPPSSQFSSGWAPEHPLTSPPIVSAEPGASHGLPPQPPASYPPGFVPLSTGPTITEVGPEPIGDLPALDAFSLDDLDFGGLSELDKDLLGAEGAGDPAALWEGGASVLAPAVGVDGPETSPPSFAMPDFGDLSPLAAQVPGLPK